MRLIDADALMEALGINNMDCRKCGWYEKAWSRCRRGSDFSDACCAIEHAPTIEPEFNEMLVICDCCGHAIHVTRR